MYLIIYNIYNSVIQESSKYDANDIMKKINPLNKYISKKVLKNKQQNIKLKLLPKKIKNHKRQSRIYRKKKTIESRVTKANAYYI